MNYALRAGAIKYKCHIWSLCKICSTWSLVSVSLIASIRTSFTSNKKLSIPCSMMTRLNILETYGTMKLIFKPLVLRLLSLFELATFSKTCLVLSQSHIFFLCTLETKTQRKCNTDLKWSWQVLLMLLFQLVEERFYEKHNFYS